MSEARTYMPRKVYVRSKFLELLAEYPKVFVVSADNVGSKQLQQIRVALRGTAELLMGKNTLLRQAMRRDAIPANPKLEALLPHIKGNVGFVFTKADLSEVKEILLSNRVPAAAKAGAIAPCNVIVPPGTTGLDPGQTSFFQALNIPTKINRGQIEIANEVHLITEGDKVGSSEAALLQKLNIKPFDYGLIIEAVYDNGEVFGARVLDLTDEDISNFFMAGVQRVACVALAAGLPALAAVPHMFVNGYKNVLAIAAVTELTFAQAEQMKAYLANPEAFAVAAPAASAAEETKEEEPEESSDEDMGFSLFD